MNPYLIDIAREHQAKVRREVETQHQLNASRDQDQSDRRRGIPLLFKVILVIPFLLDLLRKLK